MKLRHPKIVKKSKRGRPVDISKHDQILDVAAALFMGQGFHATSMDDIAAKAHMSKLTLYSRFPDKNALFAAVITRKCQEYVPDKLFNVFDHKSPREALTTFGHALFSLLLSEDAIRMHRMMGAEAAQNPALTQLFFETGPKRVKAMLAEKMAALAKAGLLHIQNPHEAKDIFTALFLGSEMFMRRLMNIGPKPTAQAMTAHVRKVVDTFLTIYGKSV